MALEIGSGNNPMYRSDVITDKFMQDNTHRCGEILIYPTSNLFRPTASYCPSARRLSTM